MFVNRPDTLSAYVFDHPKMVAFRFVLQVCFCICCFLLFGVALLAIVGNFEIAFVYVLVRSMFTPSTSLVDASWPLSVRLQRHLRGRYL